MAGFAEGGRREVELETCRGDGETSRTSGCTAGREALDDENVSYIRNSDGNHDVDSEDRGRVRSDYGQADQIDDDAGLSSAGEREEEREGGDADVTIPVDGIRDRDREENEEDEPVPLSLVIQGPDGALFVGTDGAKDFSPLPPSGNDHFAEVTSAVSYNFAPASVGTAPGLEAVHIVFPERPPGSNNPNSAEMYTLETVLTPQNILRHVHRKRFFLIILLIGSAFYMSVFFSNIGHSDRNSQDDKHQSNSHKTALVDSESYKMLTQDAVWLSTAYLVLFLSLDMIALSGTLLDNEHLLTFYVVVETVFACISALDFWPILIFRIAIIVVAFQVRNDIFAIRAALRRLHLRVTGEHLPTRFQNFMVGLGVRSR